MFRFLAPSLVIVVGCGRTIASSDASVDAAASALHQQWVDACIASVACLDEFSVRVIGIGGGTTTCVMDRSGWVDIDYAALSDTLFQVRCVADAGADCNAVYLCNNGGKPSAPCSDDAGFSPSSCNGSSVSYCRLGHTMSEDCAASDRRTTCTQFAPMQAMCSLGACATSGSMCTGNRVVNCGAGILTDEGHCDSYAESACATVDGGPACVGTGAACATDRCEGDRLRHCLGGKEASFDCTARGLGCVASDAGVHCALGAECDEAFKDSCTGATLTFCDDGKIATVDCAARGWKTCATDPDWGARCRP